MTPLAALAVVVPAHDEARLLPTALAALRRAAQHPELPVGRVLTVVVADACTDATPLLAARLGAHVVRVAARSPGRARAAGVQTALGLLGLPPERVWIASTDADSRVPPAWLAQQYRWARSGWDATVGTVRPAGWEPALTEVIRRETERYRESAPGGAHPHVHGANLGVRGDAYLRVGGFPPLATGEDRALVTALEQGGHRVLRTRRCPVATSARLRPRAVGGYGAHLARLAEETGFPC